jgi:very-short-patch-repair endonuclease/uncharacterized Zn-finger protein
MKRNKKQCNKCHKEISLSNFKRHYNSCGKLNKHQKINEEWKQENGMFKCPYCEKEYKKLGIGFHIWKDHTEIGKQHNPNKTYKEGRIAWNKGLTKETDERVKKYVQTLIDNIKSGKIIPSQKGKPLSLEQKNKISETLINYLKEHPDKVPYLNNHSSKMSYPEKLLYDKLISLDIKDWIYRYRNSIYEYDFAWPKLKIDVEIDGSTHNTEKVKNIDKRRDKFSRENGWLVLRFTTEQIKYDLNNCINVIKKELKI